MGLSGGITLGNKGLAALMGVAGIDTPETPGTPLISVGTLPAPLVSRTLYPYSAAYTSVPMATIGNRITLSCDLVGPNATAALGAAVDNAQIAFLNSLSVYGGGALYNGENGGSSIAFGPAYLRASIFFTSDGITLSANIPLTFSGQLSVLVPDGEQVFCDPIAVQLPATGGWTIVRTEWTSTIAGQVFAVSRGYGASATDATVLGTDVVYQSTLTLADNAASNRTFSPTIICGTMASPPHAKYLTHRFLEVGDSITENGAAWDTTITGANVAYCWFAQAGHKGRDWFLRQDRGGYFSARYDTVWHGFPTLIWNWIVNDLDGGLTSAQCKAHLQAFCEKFAQCGGQRLLVSTCTPLTNSTDGWATAANQTARWSVAYADYNAWVRALTPADVSGLEVHVIDVSAAVADPGDAAKWKNAAGYTNDGVHLTASGVNAVRAAIATQATAAILADFDVPLGSTYLRPGGDEIFRPDGTSIYIRP